MILLRTLEISFSRTSRIRTYKGEHKKWKTEKCTKQPALTVETNAKYHSNQQKENLLDVTTVFEKTDQKDDLTIEAAEIEAADEALTDNQEKCTKQHAPTVIVNVTYHSNQQKESLYIAKIVLQNDEIN